MRLVSRRVALRARAASDLRCAICHGSAGGSAQACLRCGALCHEDCRASHGRCPTLGCGGRAKARPHRLPERARLEDVPPVRARDVALLWGRLLVRTTFGGALALIIIPFGLLATIASLFALATGQPVAIVGVLLGFCIMLLGSRAAGFVNAERVFQNRVRELVARERPFRVVGRVSRGTGRLELRDGAGSRMLLAIAPPFFFGLPRWVREREDDTYFVRGLDRACLTGGPLVVHGRDGRTWFVPPEQVVRAA